MTGKTKKEKVRAVLEITGVLDMLFEQIYDAAFFALANSIPEKYLPPENARPEEIKAFEERVAAAAEKVEEAVKNYAVERMSSDFTDKEFAVILKFFKSAAWTRFAESGNAIIGGAQEALIKAVDEELKNFSAKTKNDDPESKDPKKNPNIQ